MMSRLGCGSVLGPLQVCVDGRVVPLRGVKQRRLMAALIAMPNRVVSSDRLVDMVWADAPPEGAAAALAKDVYRVRTALGSVGAAGLLATQPPGYRLVVGPLRLNLDSRCDTCSHASTPFCAIARTL